MSRSMASDVLVRRATLGDLEIVAPLFDRYRQFYGQPADAALAAGFLRERLERSESVVLLAATSQCGAAGFCQLYPSFCSVAAAPILVLYDLFVDPTARRRGVARALLEGARDEGLRAGVSRMDLQTARTNAPARALYESLGWTLDTTFDTYHLAL